MKKFKKPNARHGARGVGPSRGPSRPQHTSLPKGRPVVGFHAVRELLRVRPHAVAELWVRDKSSADLNEILESAAARRIPTSQRSAADLERILPVHQGVIAFAQDAPEMDWSALAKKSKATLVVLDEVGDPHNLGAILRTGWLFGIDGILIPEHRSAPLSAAVSKVAQGGVEHVPIVRESGLLETIKHLKTEGFWVLGLSHLGTQSLYKTEVPEKVIWVLGSESSGIRKPLERECDVLVRIPQRDSQASLNVSVAAGVALGFQASQSK